jgi:putative adenylate-forming enzyme
LNTFETVRQFVFAKRRWAKLQGDSLKKFQDARASAIVHWVAQHSGFYRDYWKGHDLEQWSTLPIVDKSLMMANFAQFNTKGISSQSAFEIALRAEKERDFLPKLDDLTVGLSSGTSGHRGVFLVSPLEQSIWAGVILARTLPRFRFEGERIAFFLRSNSNLYEQVGRGRWLQFRYFDLMATLEDSIRALNALQPSILIAPPSMLVMLAQAQGKGVLRIRPDVLISVAEVLEPQDQQLLETVFQTSVRQIYQATEGLLAVSCHCGSLHLQEDMVFIQPEPLLVDPTRFVPIITDLWRKTQPIIRYRLNDILTLDPKPCACASSWRVIRGIEGRQDDLLEFELQSGQVRIFFPDAIRRAILMASPHILEYEAVQERIGHLRVQLAIEPGHEDEVHEAITSSFTTLFEEYGCRQIRLEVVYGLPARDANIKRRRVRRELNG